jgi:hypothetical protein
MNENKEVWLESAQKIVRVDQANKAIAEAVKKEMAEKPLSDEGNAEVDSR